MSVSWIKCKGSVSRFFFFVLCENHFDTTIIIDNIKENILRERINGNKINLLNLQYYLLLHQKFLSSHKLTKIIFSKQQAFLFDLRLTMTFLYRILLILSLFFGLCWGLRVENIRWKLNAGLKWPEIHFKKCLKYFNAVIFHWVLRLD